MYTGINSTQICMFLQVQISGKVLYDLPVLGRRTTCIQNRPHTFNNIHYDWWTITFPAINVISKKLGKSISMRQFRNLMMHEASFDSKRPSRWSFVLLADSFKEDNIQRSTNGITKSKEERREDLDGGSVLSTLIIREIN